MITVPSLRPVVPLAPVQTSRPVSGTAWSEAAELSNWLQAAGAQLIPWCAVGSVVSEGTQRTLHFRTHARPRATQRLWLFWIHQAPKAGESYSCTVELPSGEVFTIPTDATAGPLTALRAVPVVETLAERSSAEETLKVVVTTVNADAHVIAVSCYELTRGAGLAGASGVRLGDTTPLDATSDDHGVDVESCSADRPILVRPYRSLPGVDAAYRSISPHVRRWHFFWSGAQEEETTFSGYLSTASTTGVEAFAVPIRLLGSTRTPGALVRDVRVEVWAQAIGGDASVIISGDDTIAILIGAAGRYGDVVPVACTQLDEANGGTMGTLTVTLQCDTATELRLAAVSVFELPP